MSCHIYIYIYIAQKRRMKYDPEKIVTHVCELHV